MADEVIQLRDVRLACVCGALPEEQHRRQPYEVDLDVVANVEAATRSDELGHTVNYAEILDAVERVAVEESFQLFERMATRFAEVVLAIDRVTEVTVEVRKLRPPVPQDLASSGIRLTRRG